MTNGIVQFRVRAKNLFGLSDWSEISMPLDIEQIFNHYDAAQSQVRIFLKQNFHCEILAKNRQTSFMLSQMIV